MHAILHLLVVIAVSASAGGPDGGFITGTVVDENGAPLAQAEVCAHPFSMHSAQSFPARDARPSRTEEDPLEAAHIVSGARFLKLSDPYPIRQPS